MLENSWRGCKYYANWRNARLNGASLAAEGLQKLREYTIPNSGALRLDYVTYRVRSGGAKGGGEGRGEGSGGRGRGGVIAQGKGGPRRGAQPPGRPTCLAEGTERRIDTLDFSG